MNVKWKKIVPFFLLLISLSHFILFPVYEAKAQLGICDTASSEEAKQTCYLADCEKQFPNKGEEAKRLSCKKSACQKSYTDISDQEECQVDSALLDEANNYLNNDSRFNDLYQNTQIFHIVTMLLSMVSIFSLVASLGAPCRTLSGTIGTVIAVLNVIIYFMIILRTNVKLSNLKKELYPGQNWSHKDRSIFTKLTEKITGVLSPIVNKIKLGGDIKDGGGDGTLKGFQFFIEREKIMLENLKLYLAKVVFILVLNSAAILAAIIEISRGEVASGSCDSFPIIQKRKNGTGLLSQFLAIIPIVFANDSNSFETIGGLGKRDSLGKVDSDYSRSYLGSILSTGIGIFIFIVKIAIKKSPNLSTFFKKIKMNRVAALTRLATHTLYEMIYMIEIILYSFLIKLLSGRIRQLKNFSCRYIHEVNFDFENNRYWRSVCKGFKNDAKIINDETSDATSLNGEKFWKTIFPFKNAIAQFVGTEKSEDIFNLCFKKNNQYDENCSCRKSGGCLSLSQLVSSKMPKEVVKFYQQHQILGHVDQILSGDNYANYNKLDFLKQWKKSSILNQQLLNQVSLKKGKKNLAIPSYDQVRKQASDQLMTTLENMKRDNDASGGKIFELGLQGIYQENEMALNLVAKNDLSVIKSGLLEEMIIKMDSGGPSQKEIERGKNDAISGHQLQGAKDFKGEIRETLSTENENLFKKITHRYQRSFWNHLVLIAE